MSFLAHKESFRGRSDPADLQAPTGVVAHRGGRAVEVKEVEVDADVFYDLFLSFGFRNQAHPTGRYDKLFLPFRFIYAILVHVFVLFVASLIASHNGSSGMVGAIRLPQFEQRSFVVSLPAALKSVTNDQRVQGRLCELDPARPDTCQMKDVNDICQGVINGMALHHGSVEKLLVDRPVTLRAQLRKHMIFWKAADRLWLTKAVEDWLFALPYNRALGESHREKVSAISGLLSTANMRPSALVQANDQTDPDKMEEEIIDFILTHCPLSSQYGQYERERPQWALLSGRTRELWGILGIYPTKCDLSSASGVSSESACAGTSNKEACRQVGCCYWTEKSGDGTTGICRPTYNNTLCYGAGTLGSTSDQAAKTWLHDNYKNIFYKHECRRNLTLGVNSPLRLERGARLKWHELGPLRQEAAAELGFDEQSWNDETTVDQPLYDSNLVLKLENYLIVSEPYFFFQVMSALLLGWASISEVRSFVVSVVLALDWASSWKLFFLLVLLSFFSYVFVPVVVVFVSWLVIMESGSIMGVIKDTIAMMFLLELNNLLMFTFSPDSARWKVMVSVRCSDQIEWCRNNFHRVVCVLMAFLVGVYMILMSDWEYAALKNYAHPSIALNYAHSYRISCEKEDKEDPAATDDQGPLSMDQCNSLQLGVMFVVVLSFTIALTLAIILAYSLNCQRPTKDMNKWHKAMDKLQRTERSESPSEYDDEGIAVDIAEQKRARRIRDSNDSMGSFSGLEPENYVENKQFYVLKEDVRMMKSEVLKVKKRVAEIGEEAGRASTAFAYRRTFNKAMNFSDNGNGQRGPIPSSGLNEEKREKGDKSGAARAFFLDADFVHETAGNSSTERPIDTGEVSLSQKAGLVTFSSPYSQQSRDVEQQSPVPFASPPNQRRTSALAYMTSPTHNDFYGPGLPFVDSICSEDRRERPAGTRTPNYLASRTASPQIDGRVLSQADMTHTLTSPQALGDRLRRGI